MEPRTAVRLSVGLASAAAGCTGALGDYHSLPTSGPGGPAAQGPGTSMMSGPGRPAAEPGGAGGAAGTPPGMTAADAPIDFFRDIQPILGDYCVRCHGGVREL